MTNISNVSAYGVIGDPIAQSLSPDIHNLWINRANINAYYNKFHLQTDTASDDLKVLYRFGVKGLNVTMPYKDAAFNSAVKVSEFARIIGVANTLMATPEGWYADNSDALGFLNALKASGDFSSLKDINIFLIGAGGAARAVAYILDKESAKLTIANRTVEKADALIKELAPNAKSSDLSNLTEQMDAADIVINATSLKSGLTENISFPDGKSRLFYDLSYGLAPQAILAKAKENGWKTEDGLRMLVEQAAISHELWHNEKPDVETALNLCRGKLK